MIMLGEDSIGSFLFGVRYVEFIISARVLATANVIIEDLQALQDDFIALHARTRLHPRCINDSFHFIFRLDITYNASIGATCNSMLRPNCMTVAMISGKLPPGAKKAWGKIHMFPALLQQLKAEVDAEMTELAKTSPVVTVEDKRQAWNKRLDEDWKNTLREHSQM
eukprot:scaffold40430_cov26-Prasinocladus_malaysianus.AAC.1